MTDQRKEKSYDVRLNEDEPRRNKARGRHSLRQGSSPESRSARLLPPIVISSEFNSQRETCTSSKSPTLESKHWSRYHRGMSAKDFSVVNSADIKMEKKSKRLGKHSTKDIEVDIIDYLDRNRDFLEAYIIDSVPINQVERWLVKKMTRDIENKPFLSDKCLVRHGHKKKITKKEIFMELVNKLNGDTNEHSITLELARFMSFSVGVDAYRVYKLYPDHPTFVQYFEFDSTSDLLTSTKLARAENDKIQCVLEVAKNGACLVLSKKDTLSFPKMSNTLFRTFDIKNENEANHVLYQPILTANGKTAYVIEMWRLKDKFENKDEKISSDFVVWGSLILHYCNLYLDKKSERNMSDFLLDVVKAIFEEMVSLDQLIKRILEFAQRLVNADRASLFLVDYSNFELVSTVFDLKFEPGQGRDMEKKEIRMPINRGIAGHVALSGETMNIPDAYSDYRFNREVDEATGYKTISILCMPVKVQGKVIGVVQMVNKRNNDNFDHEDEVAFEIFSTFFGLALHHARLYDKIMRKEQKYRVALEVLSYHNTCREHEVQEILTDNKQLVANIYDFYLDPYQLDDFQKCKAVITMFDDLFELSKFDFETITRFILTVKKNYRTVPYHNFDHGWSVAHAMYVILKSDNRKRFDYKMRLALFVACLCHDLDHRGYTNKYMNETASPLAAMYTTSPLEHHHFNITVTILQQDGHNIFSHLTSDEYKDILRYIRHCILATDLAAFFPNLAKLKEIYGTSSQNSKFNWTVPGHRDLAMAISMTAADLSASTKPWDIQIKTVKVIFEEFYDQGDKERAAGKTPIPMMDRNKPEEQPSSQVGFLSQICIPCYNMLYKILPKTKPMYVMSLRNLKNWKSKVIVKDKDESSNEDDTLDFETESDLDEDDCEELLEEADIQAKDNMENKEILKIGHDIQEIHDDDEEIHIQEISGEMRAGWKCIKSDSVSWEDDQVVTDNVDTKTASIWKDIEGNWVDDEGVVTRPKRSLKIILVESKDDEDKNN
ncbi:probable 3',5'-cyclic phosphodiesterase pde-5 isoform X1 [Vanessa tameamea]|uniref:Phosphodiesterase n=2 Tax=Vanessa tameamea TaxID=334116 RepID=A0A8B8IXN7_VANTA